MGGRGSGSSVAIHPLVYDKPGATLKIPRWTVPPPPPSHIIIHLLYLFVAERLRAQAKVYANIQSNTQKKAAKSFYVFIR